MDKRQEDRKVTILARALRLQYDVALEFNELRKMKCRSEYVIKPYRQKYLDFLKLWEDTDDNCIRFDSKWTRIAGTNLAIKDVIFSNPATVVLWSDDTKTIVKCGEHDTFDEEKGLAMAIIKKLSDNKGNFNQLFRKYCHYNDTTEPEKVEEPKVEAKEKAEPKLKKKTKEAE